MCMICFAEISDDQPFLIVYQRDSSTGDIYDVGAIHFECPGEIE